MSAEMFCILKYCYHYASYGKSFVPRFQHIEQQYRDEVQ